MGAPRLMPKRALAARLDFYNPSTGALRTQLSDNVRRIEIREVARDEADDAGFDIANPNLYGSSFFEGDEVRVFVKTEGDSDLVHIWTGCVDSLNRKRHSQSFADLPIKAQDFVYWRLAHAFVTDSYQNMKAGAIVRAIMTNYLPGITATSATVEDTTTTIPSITFNGVSALAAIRDIAELAAAEWKGDKDKTLHFYAKKSKSSGLSVDPTKVVRGSFSIETSMAGFGNVQKVRGGSRALLDATNGESFGSWANIAAATRKKAKVTPTKSRFAQVELWTSPGDGNDIPSNPGFETGDLTGWTVAATGIESTPAVITDGTAPEGTKTLRVKTDSGTQTAYLTRANIAAVPGVPYRLSARGKGTGIVNGANVWDTLRVTVKQLRSDLSVISFHDLFFGAGTYGWTLLTTDFTTASDCAWIAWEAVGLTWAVGEGWLDDIRVAPRATGDLRLRIQASNAAGTAPIDENDDTRDLASRVLSQEFLAANGWTTFLIPDHILPPGGSVWLIVDCPTTGLSQRVGMDVTGPDLMWRTYYPVPVIVERQDTASVTKYGKRELPPVVDKTIATEAEANLIADMRLAQYAVPARQGEYEVSDMALAAAKVGETLTATFTNDNVTAGTVLVLMEKRHVYDANRGTYSLRHSVADAERIRRLEEIILSIARKLQRVEDSVMGRAKDTLVDIIRQVPETARVADTVTRTVQNAGTFKVGAAKVGFSTVG